MRYPFVNMCLNTCGFRKLWRLDLSELRAFSYNYLLSVGRIGEPY